MEDLDGPGWTWGDNDNSNKGPYTWQPYEYSAIGQHQWALEHIKNHGALGGAYPLRENHDGKLVFIEGGGTIPWLGLVHRGLSDFTHPAWGGWSGRFSDEKVKNVYSRHSRIKATEVDYGDFEVYQEAADDWYDTSTGATYNNNFAPIWRWRQAYFDDFKCRMDWCVAEYKNANHHPVAAINGDASEKIHFIEAKPGEQLKIDGSASSDPDDDELHYHWWIYDEAGTYQGENIKIENKTKVTPTIHIPEDASGKTIHLIFELKDSNVIGVLTDYRRVVIQVK